MKIRLRLLAITLTLALLLMPAATALAVPTVPLQYQGSVSIDVVEAPIGTIITAEIDGEEVATNAPGGTTAVGTYKLDVVADEGDVVILKVNGVIGGETTHPDPMTNWKVDLDLSVGEAPPLTLTAEAGGPYSGAVGEEIALEGSASGGTSPYIYAWDLDNDGEFDDAEGASPSHSWDTADTYTIGLQVTDNAAATATDTATVTVIAEGGFDPYIYDTDEDGILSYDETLAAVSDYLAGDITKEQALEVVKLYFS